LVVWRIELLCQLIQTDSVDAGGKWMSTSEDVRHYIDGRYRRCVASHAAGRGARPRGRRMTSVQLVRPRHGRDGRIGELQDWTRGPCTGRTVRLIGTQGEEGGRPTWRPVWE